MSSKRGWIVAAAVLIMLVVAAVGANSPTPALVQAPGGEASMPTIIPVDPPSAQSDDDWYVQDLPEIPEFPGIPRWLLDAALAAMAFLIIPVIIWVLVRFIRAQLAMRRPRAKNPDVQFREIDIEVDEEDLAEEFSTAIQALRRGVAVDEAILECWRGLERLAADSGLVRRPTQTSTEFTVDVLTHTAADAPALERLAELYRRAAFSTHQLTDAHRDDAVDALEILHDSLTGATR